MLAALVVVSMASEAHAGGPVQIIDSEHVLTVSRAGDAGSGFFGNASDCGATAAISGNLGDHPDGVRLAATFDMVSGSCFIDGTLEESGGFGNASLTLEVTEDVEYTLAGAASYVGDPANEDRHFTAGFGGGLIEPGPFESSGTLEPGSHEFSVSGRATNPPEGANQMQFVLEIGDLCDTDTDTDADGDALPDCWETDGIDFDGDGSVDLDLPAMGADPMHKDIFLELDPMAGHALFPAAIDRVVAAFGAAPVANPDGLPGITLHVDNGPVSVMNPLTGQLWGALSDQDVLTHQDVVGGLSGGNYDWSAFDAIKAANFSSDREPAFHYAVSGHRLDASHGASGVSRGFGASDLLVTLGPTSEPGEGSGTVAQQAGTLMHELGHNLGLRHGGDDDFNYKANYLSVMNYSFQMGGLARADGTRILDYSRLAIALDESALDEDNGFGYPAGTDPAQFITLAGCPNNPTPIGRPGTLDAIPLLASPVDWDCDSATGGQVAADINGDGLISAFTPFLDWPALVYAGGAIGDAGASFPQETEMIEPELDELLENEKVLDAAGGGGGGASPVAAGTGSPGAALSSAFSFLGKVKLNKQKGTATLTVEVPGPGSVSLSGKGVKAQRAAPAGRAAASKAVGAAGKVTLLIKPRGKAKAKLNEDGRAKVKVNVTYTPTGGSANTQTKRITLKKAIRRGL